MVFAIVCCNMLGVVVVVWDVIVRSYLVVVILELLLLVWDVCSLEML